MTRQSRIGGSLLLVLVVVVGVVWNVGSRGEGLVLVVMPTADNPFWQDMTRGALEARDILRDSTEVLIRVGQADTDARSQITIIESQLAAGNVVALVLGPASSTAVIPAVAQYNAAGIPVVVVDSRLDSAELIANGARVDLFLGSKNRDGGRLAAQRLQVHLGSGPAAVLLVQGSPVHETARERAGGFLESVPPQWTIDSVGAEWDRTQAMNLMRGILARSVPDGVFAASDEMAMGVIDALESVGVPNDEWPAIIGFDATEDGLRSIQANKMCATIAQQPVEIGRTAVLRAWDLVRGNVGATDPLALIDVQLVPETVRPCGPRVPGL